MHNSSSTIDNNQLVSILIPCYNSASYIAETLDSVISQTHTNWECIVVDDHSSDHSVDIVNKYCEKYSNKIKLNINPRKGACAARNIAFENSQGEFIQYLDADDLLSNNKIEEQIKLFREYGNNILPNCRWGRFADDPSIVKWEYQKIDHDYDNPVDWLIDSWMGDGMMAQHGWLIPRNIVEKAGLWNEELKINQDGEFFCRIIMNADKIKFTQNCGVYYRFHNNNSIGKQRSEEAMASQLFSYQLYKNHLESQEINKIQKNKLFKALAAQFSDFYIRNKIAYPLLAAKAKKNISEMGKKLSPQGGATFKIMCRLFGVDRAINLREKIKQ